MPAGLEESGVVGVRWGVTGGLAGSIEKTGVEEGGGLRVLKKGRVTGVAEGEGGEIAGQTGLIRERPIL